MSAEARSESEDFGGQMLRWAGTFFVFSIGMVHMLQAEEFFAASAYVGALSLVNFSACCGIAILLARSGGMAVWLLGAGLSVASLALLVISRTWGMPGYEEVVGQWLNFPAWSVVGMELSYLALCAAALRKAR